VEIMADKKKKKKQEDDDDDSDDFTDDLFKNLNDQLGKIFQNIPGMPKNLDANSMGLPFKKIFKDILKQMNLSQDDLNNMNQKDLQDLMKKNMKNMNFQGPFVFGMNMRVGPDGKPFVDSFGNMNAKQEGKGDIKQERDPLVDIYEEDEMVIVVMEVPGVDKDQVELRASPNELEVFAETSDGGPHPRKYHKIIQLPTEINPDVAKARYQNGILEVKLSKVEQKIKKKKINID
jgi:HSP20 family protein